MKLAQIYTKQMAEKWQFKGIFNVQFVIHHDKVYVLEVNPRASRTVPIMSKITGVNIIEECIHILTGSSNLNEIDVNQNYYAVKNPVFSTGKLDGVDPVLTPEMKSTGELIAFGSDFKEALAKAVKWNHQTEFKADLTVFVDVEEKSKTQSIDILKDFGVAYVDSEQADSFSEWIKLNRGSILISNGQSKLSKEYRIKASAAQLTVITELDTLREFLSVWKNAITAPKSLNEWQKESTIKETVM